MILQDKLTLFINRAQSKITALSLHTAKGLSESYVDGDDVELANELMDVLESLGSEFLDWSDQDKETVIDYYNLRANLTDIAVVSFSLRGNNITSNPGGDQSWVAPFNALNTKVEAYHVEVTEELIRLDNRIDNLDFEGLVPQSLLDDVQDNKDARHTHDNKDVIDQLNSGHLQSINLNDEHRGDGDLHVTSAQKSDWSSRATQQQITDLDAAKSDVGHEHEMSDIDGLQEAFEGLAPEKGDPGEDGLQPVLVAGTVSEGELAVEIDSTDPALPKLNLTIPKGEDGQDFHIDVFGNSGDRLDSAYDNEDAGFSLLGQDNGMLYFRRPYDESDTYWPATSTGGWTNVQFMGYNGWTPILGLTTISSDKTVVLLVGWTGGTGDQPSIGTPGLPTYLGPTGFTQDINEATNVKGPAGPIGETGKAVFPDASGELVERDQYDGSDKDFMFYDSSTGLMYVKRSDTVADWSVGYQWRGDQGEKGDKGDSGPGGSSELLEDVVSFGVGDVGGVAEGDTLEEGLSFTDYVKRVHQALKPLVNPTASLSSSPSSTQEIGVSVSFTLTPSFNQNDAGLLNSVVFKRNTTVIHTQTDLTPYSDSHQIVQAGDNPYSVDISYDEGTADPQKDGVVPAGTVVGNRSISGAYRNWFGPNGTSDPVSGSDIRDLGFTYNNTFTLNTGSSDLKHVIAIPSTKSIVSIIDVDALNASMKDSYILSGSITTVPDGGGNAVSYKVFILSLATAYSSNHRHEVIIS